MRIDVDMLPKQRLFFESTADEILYGGAAGGGKSHIQIIDAMLYALRYPGSKQLVLRRTFPELEKSLIRKAVEIYPPRLYKYNSSAHTVRWKNGSIIDFGHCQREADVQQYQSAEYDVIRFDEATHFTEYQYTYLTSRLRGVNKFPKQIKATANPGSVGHQFIKNRFITPSPPLTEFTDGLTGLRRIFIPCLAKENLFLQRDDPKYMNRLDGLPEKERRALRDGDWDVFIGQYFTEFSRNMHVCEPFPLPRGWRRYRAFDYGLDALACLWFAMAPNGMIYVYREREEENVTLGNAVSLIDSLSEGEGIYATYYPPDMMGRSQESGRSKIEIMRKNGLEHAVESSNNREAGWLAVKELLNGHGEEPPRLQIFKNCVKLIEYLPLLQHDEKHPTDVATEPHGITHLPDALRYFSVQWARPARLEHTRPQIYWPRDLVRDYERASAAERAEMRKIYGAPPTGIM